MPVAASSQVSPQAARPDKAIPISHSPTLTQVSETPKMTSVPTAPQFGTHPEMDPNALSDEVLQLQEEMNRAMGCFLTTRASMDTCCRKQVSDFETAFCQNEAQTTEAIREAEAVCAAALLEAKACCATMI